MRREGVPGDVIRELKITHHVWSRTETATILQNPSGNESVSN